MIYQEEQHEEEGCVDSWAFVCTCVHFCMWALLSGHYYGDIVMGTLWGYYPGDIVGTLSWGHACCVQVDVCFLLSHRCMNVSEQVQ